MLASPAAPEEALRECLDGAMASDSETGSREQEPQRERQEKPGSGAPSDPAGEVVELCRDLIRIDTSNYGDEDGPGERKAAEHVAALLDEVGIEAEVHEAEPGRANVVAQWGDTSSERGGLLLHGHLD